MKKTLVAVAAMAAVTGAFAQATISGVIDQAYYTSRITSAVGAAVNSKGVGAQNNGTSEFTISGKEDLGNGMNASFAFNVQADLGSSGTAANTAAQGTGTNNGMAMRRSFIGLAGDFGSVKLGNQWTPIFFTVLAADPTALVSTTGAGLVGAGYAVGANANSITYALPTVVPGLGITLQKGQGNEDYGTSASTAGANTGGNVTYASGALMASYSYQKATAGTTGNFTTSAGALSSNVTTLAALTAGTSKVSSSATALTYDLGMAKASYLMTSDKITGTTAKVTGNAYGLSVPVTGATTLALIMSSTSNTSTAAATSKEKGSRYAVFHALSKRTTAYAFMGKSSLNGATTAHSMTAFGLQHGF